MKIIGNKWFGLSKFDDDNHICYKVVLPFLVIEILQCTPKIGMGGASWEIFAFGFAFSIKGYSTCFYLRIVNTFEFQ